jgi:hypothetical protein
VKFSNNQIKLKFNKLKCLLRAGVTLAADLMACDKEMKSDLRSGQLKPAERKISQELEDLQQRT